MSEPVRETTDEAAPPLRMLAAKIGGRIIPTTIAQRDAVVIARAMEAGHSIRSVQLIAVEVREVPDA